METPSTVLTIHPAPAGLTARSPTETSPRMTRIGADDEPAPSASIREIRGAWLESLRCVGAHALALFATAIHAPVSQPPDSIPLQPGPDQVTIASARLQEDRPVLVFLPESYRHTTDRYPVLVVVDGDGPGARRAMSVVNLLSELIRGEIPELIVVTIPNTNRTRDLRPAPPPGTKVSNPTGVPAAPEANARRFLEFIEFELLPAIDRRYRTHPVRFLHGSSYGGIFGLFAFVERPELFRGIVASCPSAWIDDGVWIPAFERSLASRPATPQWLFVSAGEFDHPLITIPLPKIEAALRAKAPAFLSWRVEVMKGRDHQSAEAATLMSGLRHIFAGFDLPHPEATALSIGELRRRYESVTAHYGWTVRPPLWAWNRMPLNKDAVGHPSVDVLAVTDAMVSDYPWHPYGHEAVTWFTGESEKSRALASAEEALSVARESGYWTRDLETTVAKLRKELGR
jgi:hypothetical protein